MPLHSPYEQVQRREELEAPEKEYEGFVVDTKNVHVWKNANSQPIHRHNVRTCGSARGIGFKGRLHLGVIVGHKNAHSKRAQDEEGRETVEDGPKGPRHHNARVLRLAGRHGDIVGPGNREGGQDKALQEAEELARVARVKILSEGTRVLPVPKAEAIAEGVAA